MDILDDYDDGEETVDLRLDEDDHKGMGVKVPMRSQPLSGGGGGGGGAAKNLNRMEFNRVGGAEANCIDDDNLTMLVTRADGDHDDDDDDEEEEEEEEEKEEGASQDLVQELHRIQGLLGVVLQRRGAGGAVLPPPLAAAIVAGETSPPRGAVATSSPTPPPKVREGAAALGSGALGNGYPPGPAAYGTPGRDEEVEKLRTQLNEQEITTSLRKADSSFLQSQLHEKDSLLREVSKILEAVERRQMELESENSRVKERLAAALEECKKKEREVQRLHSVLTALDDF